MKIEKLTSLPKDYTPEAMGAAAERDRKSYRYGTRPKGRPRVSFKSGEKPGSAEGPIRGLSL